MYMNKKKRKIPLLSQAVRNYYLIVNTCLLLVFGSCILFITMKILVDRESRTSEIITEQAALSINSTFDDIIAQMVSFSSHTELITQIGRKTLPIQEQLDLERELKTVLKKTGLFIKDIFVVGDNGYVFSTITASGLLPDYDYWSQDWYHEAKSTEDKIYIRMLGLHPQDFYSSGFPVTSSKETFSMSFALQNARGNVVGALIYNFDIDQMAEILNSSTYERNGKLALLDENNVVVSQNDNRQLGETLVLSEKILDAMDENKNGTLQGTVNGQTCLLSFQTIGRNWKLVSYVPQSEILRHAGSMVVVLALTLAACLFLNLLIASQVTRSIRKPIRKLTENIQNIESEHLVLEPNGYQYQELDQIAEKFSGLLDRVDTLIQKDYKSQLLLNKFRLYSLQSQINPHFLMNTLQQLQTEIVYGNVEVSNDIVVSLSKMLRYSLYHYEAIVPIPMELQYIRSYLELFIRKYEGELRAEYEITEEVEQYYMPKLLLQPVVENCITHAFQENPENAVIRIEVKSEEGRFRFFIKDNGHGMSQKQLEELAMDINRPEVDDKRIGIRNIHQRIRLLYGTSYGVEIISEEGSGTCFILSLPKIKAEDIAEGGERRS